MENVTYLDCYATVGRRGTKDERAAWKTETLMEEMEHCGIHGALVTHALAKEYDPIFGNKALMRELSKSRRLYGAWTVVPHHCSDMPRAKDIISQMRDNNIRAARMYPKLHHYDFDETSCGELFGELEKNDIPLFVESGLYENYAQISFKEVDYVCSAHPGLRLVLLATRWESPRQMIPLMEKHPGIFIEFSSFQANRAIEWFTDLFGAERLLFGTEFPEKSPGAAKAFIDYAQISQDERRLIAGGNLARLLKMEGSPGQRSAGVEDDGILEKVKAGMRLDNITLIDSHAHISHDGANGVGSLPQLKSDADGLFERDSVIGISKACISSWVGIVADYEAGNEIVYQAIRQYPSHFIGYASIDPNYVEDWAGELKQCYGEFGFVGIKPYYPRTHVPYNDPRLAKWFRFGNQHRLFALLHPSDRFAEEVEEISHKYPEVKFLLAHSGMSFKAARDHCEIARKRKNVYVEITYTAVTYGSIELMVEEVGENKVLFGTDQPMRDPIPQLGWVAYSHISEKAKKKILGENMARVLGRCRPLVRSHVASRGHKGAVHRPR
jgi:predicted TIM-barrel fold metal-dependent hydrolase